MSTFASAFREIVVPKLQRWVELEAICVARGLDSFSEAYDTIHQEARALGALHLPVDIFADLEDWIATKLLAEIDKAERLSVG